MSAPAELAVCAIFRDEAAGLAEWLAFHRLVGVERFFLYDNGSVDDWRGAIAASAAADCVVVVDCPGTQRQMPAYADCLARFGDRARWIAFIDIDEFLFAPDGTDLRRALEPYGDAPAVGANWVVFGASGHRVRPPGLVTQNYVRRADLAFAIAQRNMLKAPGLDPERPDSYRPHSSHVKAIVRPGATVSPVTPHHFTYRDGRLAVTEKGVPFDGPWSPEVSVDRLRINHYWSKSLAELDRKVRRGYACAGRGPSPEYALAIEGCLNAIRDETIFPIARRLPGWRSAPDAAVG